ncbi:isoaspartyl peptidase/L-asparaginase family protein [Sanyastnella coralliicola]|uniref:isoaspartyl peptidase/L-asparaginase family protein n=1 Tax=Sanyastnella coralliicola TaxID=3069118 RepID=UPI0027BAABAF|nr:N(4)-(beta-N-acetylglucosaminyl)-L-asparaginase [Longitalea sp. SCSIO 12813]
MSNRRSFLKRSGAALAGLSLAPLVKAQPIKKDPVPYKKGLVISTWWHGLAANDEAHKIIANGGTAVDAAEMGVRITEADATGQSVGVGGLPDRDGNVTLDACIMDSKGNAGSVCFLQDILHPVSVARKVMDDTPHVMLAGEGARRFALDNGFEKTNLLTPESEKAWKEWLKEKEYKPIINIENHDTIGLLSMDQAGDIAGACTTSGLAYKMHGRVGDSPIIGAGLFVDNEVGGATATGLGELVLRTLGSFLIVELMRQGASPQEACEEGVRRIAKRNNVKDMQVGYLAVNKAGEVGAYAIHPGFNYALHRDGRNEMIDAKSML